MHTPPSRVVFSRVLFITYVMSNILDSYTIVQSPNGQEGNASHLRTGFTVAITELGLKEHNHHNMFNTIVIGAGLGVVALPYLIGGGIGIAMGGEAIGLGLAELGLAGGATGALTASAVHKPVKGYLRDDKHKQITFVDMIGRITNIRRRWFDQPGYDVEIKWIGADEFGNRTSFTAWHDPQDIYSLEA